MPKQPAPSSALLLLIRFQASVFSAQSEKRYPASQLPPAPTAPIPSSGRLGFLVNLLPHPPPLFEKLFILKGVKVVCFVSVLEVLILKGVMDV